MPWPRKFELQITQSNERTDFATLITSVLAQENDCLVIEAQPVLVGKTKRGLKKWRQCIVQVRDPVCMTAMSFRLKNNAIVCRPKKIKANGRME